MKIPANEQLRCKSLYLDKYLRWAPKFRRSTPAVPVLLLAQIQAVLLQGILGSADTAVHGLLLHLNRIEAAGRSGRPVPWGRRGGEMARVSRGDVMRRDSDLGPRRTRRDNYCKMMSVREG